MEPQAVQRLQLLGHVFETLGASATRMGAFLRQPNLDHLEACSNDIANLFHQAAAWCDQIADLTLQQATLGVGHGYAAEDSAALATLREVFHGFGVVPVYVCSMEFTMAAEEKAKHWRGAGDILRSAGDAAWRRRDLLARALVVGIPGADI